MKFTTKKFLNKTLTSILLFAVFFFGIPGIELFSRWDSVLQNKKAEAAINYGRETRTAEFLLALGSDATTRATNVTTYTSASGWTTSAPALTSGDVITLLGKNIHVDSAQLEVSYFTTAVAAQRNDVYLKVEGSASESKFVAAGEYSGSAANTLSTGGLTGHLLTTHDITSFFDRQTDIQFQGGLNLIASLNVVGPSRFLSSMRVVMTYSVDVETVSHQLVKTVRLPLLSGATTGTRLAVCAAAATCVYNFDLAGLPDLTNKSQIKNVSVFLNGLQTANGSVGLRMTGSGTTNTFAWADGYTDTYAVRAYWNPLADAQFTVGGMESMDVVNGAAELRGLGGEIAITYEFDSDAAIQAETVRYFVNQGTALPSNAVTQLATSSLNIVNTGATIRDVWYRIGIAPSVNTNFTVTHRVKSNAGSSVGVATLYNLTMVTTTNPRAANTPLLYHVLDSSSGYYDASMDVGGQFQFSVNSTSNNPAVEAFCTFTWAFDNTLAPRTKTALFGVGQKGLGRNVASTMKVASTVVRLAEHGEKTEESIYVDTSYVRHDTTSISAGGTHTTAMNGSSLSVTESSIVEPYRKTLLAPVSALNFFGAATSSATEFPISINQYYSGADFAHEANTVVVTYSTGFAVKPDPVAKQMRTVEYVLGGGSDTTLRASGGSILFGDKQISASPTMLPVPLLGSGIRVAHAYVDVSFMMMMSTVGAQTTNALAISGDITGYGGTRSNIYLHESSGYQLISTTSGNTGYYHGQHDVTSLFGLQNDDGYWNRGDVQVRFGIATTQSAGSRSLTSMKLVVTYESDFSLTYHDEVKTVRFPLKSFDSLGTRAAVCGISVDCNFEFDRSIPDLTSVLSAHFEVTASVDGTANPNIYLASGGAQSPNYAAGEINNDSSARRYVWQILPANLNATTAANATGTLTFRNANATALSMYGIGGELVVTYSYNTGAVKQLETVAFPVGQQTVGVQAKTAIGTASPYISNANVTLDNAWIRYATAPYASGAVTLYGQLGAAAERSVAVASTVAARGGGERLYYLGLKQDVANYAFPSTAISASVGFGAATQYPTGAEVFLNYVWNGSKSGTTTRTVLYSAGQHSVTNVTGNAPQVKPASVYMPAVVGKVFRGAYLRTAFHHSSGGTFAVGTITSGVNNATSSITSLGDLVPYNSVVITPLTQDNVFGDVVPDGRDVVRVENSASTVNPMRFSNEIFVTYDEEQELQRATFFQDAFWFFTNIDNITPNDPWLAGTPAKLGESKDMTVADRPVRKTDSVRLRIGLTVASSSLPISKQAFQLQYGKKLTSCSAIDVDWQNVQAGAEWVGSANATIYPNTPLTTLKLAASDVAGLYSEDGLTAVNPHPANEGDMIEYDWSIKRNSATPESDYCFRIIESSGKKMAGYTYYPVLHTAGYTPETTYWRWYDDETAITPPDYAPWTMRSTALSLENNNIVKLRVGLIDVANESGSNERFGLQWSTDPTFVSGAQFVQLQSECTNTSIFCYADGGGADDGVLPVGKLGISGVVLGRHNEATSTSNFSPGANTHAEMEYTIKPVHQRTGQTYYFRLWDTKRNIPVYSNTALDYPAVQAEGATLNLVVSGISAGATVAGAITTAATTPIALPFGTLTIDASAYLAHRLHVVTNAFDGYVLGVQSSDDLRNGYGDAIAPVDTTGLNPGLWSSVCNPSSTGCLGYRTTDITLSGGSPDRFSPADVWSGVSSSSPQEIGHSPLPTGPTGEDVDVIYRIEPHPRATPGEYMTNIIYIVTPVY